MEAVGMIGQPLRLGSAEAVRLAEWVSWRDSGDADCLAAASAAYNVSTTAFVPAMLLLYWGFLLSCSQHALGQISPLALASFLIIRSMTCYRFCPHLLSMHA